MADAMIPQVFVLGPLARAAIANALTAIYTAVPPAFRPLLTAYRIDDATALLIIVNHRASAHLIPVALQFGARPLGVAPAGPIAGTVGWMDEPGLAAWATSGLEDDDGL